MPFFETQLKPNGVLIASYSNPPMGYFTADAAAELGGLIETWRDSSIRAVVICGAKPGVFITHYSTEELQSYASDELEMRRKGPAIFHAYHTLISTLQHLPKPVVFGLTGDTMGGGFELSLGGDIRIAQAGDYRYGQLETRLGMIPGGSATQRLTRILGSAAAIEMLMRGLIFTPEEAHARGLVHEVSEDARARAIAIADDLAGLSPVALREIKRAVYEGGVLSLEEGLRIETDAVIETLVSAEGRAIVKEYVALPYEQRRRYVERKV